MKLGIIIGHLGFGGAERVAVNLANWFTKRGDSVIFFCIKKPANKEYQILPSIVRLNCYAQNRIGIVKNLRIGLKREKPDVVLVMSSPMCVYSSPALLGLGIPTVVSERSAPGNAMIKKTTRISSNFLLQFADAYVFQTRGARSYFNRKIREKGFIIPNPLVVSELPSPFEGERSKRFVAIGRLVKEKNYPFLIRSFISFHENNPDYKLEIYGEGPEKKKIQDIIDEQGASSFVSLCGERRDVLYCVKDAFAYILSSNLEGMPNALIEAMALGLPCISTDCPSGGPADLIDDGNNGILVPVGDIEKMRAAMERVVSDSAFRLRIGSNAIQIRERLDIEVVCKLWKNVFCSVMNSDTE